jgi:hypothetical protein
MACMGRSSCFPTHLRLFLTRSTWAATSSRLCNKQPICQFQVPISLTQHMRWWNVPPSHSTFIGALNRNQQNQTKPGLLPCVRVRVSAHCHPASPLLAEAACSGAAAGSPGTPGQGCPTGWQRETPMESALQPSPQQPGPACEGTVRLPNPGQPKAAPGPEAPRSSELA